MSPVVVFDCMVFLQAATSGDGPAAACLRLAELGDVTLALSQQLLEEVREVLGRPKIRGKFPQLTDQRVDRFLSAVEGLGRLLEDVPAVFTHARDPDDEPYINLAIAAKARFLVSRDKDLLDLMGDQTFLQTCPSLTILDPASFLREIARERHEAERPERPAGPERGQELKP